MRYLSDSNGLHMDYMMARLALEEKRVPEHLSYALTVLYGQPIKMELSWLCFQRKLLQKMDRDPGDIYSDLTKKLGDPVYDRIDAPATPEQKKMLGKLSPEQVKFTELAGEKIISSLTNAPGNGASIGGLKVITDNGWFAARPSGTENIYKIYAESFKGTDHLHKIIEEAQEIVTKAVTP